MSQERGRSQGGSGSQGRQGGMGGLGGLDPQMIQEYLSDISFPTSKDSLIRSARQHGAPDMVISFLQNLPDKQYQNSSEVTREAGQSGMGGQTGRGM